MWVGCFKNQCNQELDIKFLNKLIGTLVDGMKVSNLSSVLLDIELNIKITFEGPVRKSFTTGTNSR